MNRKLKNLIEHLFCDCGACQQEGAYHTQDCVSRQAEKLLESLPLQGHVNEILQHLLLQALWAHPQYGKEMILMRNGTCQLMDKDGKCLIYRTLTEYLNDTP